MVDDGMTVLRDHLHSGLTQGRTHQYRDAIETMRIVIDQVGELLDPAVGVEPSAVESSAVDTMTEIAEIGVRARLTLAYCTYEVTGVLTDALAVLDDATSRMEAAGLDHLGVAVTQVRGYCHARAGDPAAALTAWTISHEVWSRGEAEDRARVLLNRGNLHMEQGSLRQAWEDLGRAQKIAMEINQVHLAQKARHNRGYLAYLQGDLPTALRLIGTPIEIDDPDGVVGQLLRDPIVALDRARALVEAGLFEEADDLLEGAANDLDTADRKQDEGEAHLTRARVALVIVDLDTAARESERALECFSDQDNQRWHRRAQMTRLAVEVARIQTAMQAPSPTAVGAEHVADADPTDGDAVRPAWSGRDLTMTDLAAAGRAIDALIAQCDDRHDVSLLVAARLMAAEVALLAGDVDRASKLLDGSEPADSDGISLRVRWHRARAELALASGGTASRVADLVVAGLSELASQQARLGSLDLRTAIAIHGEGLAAIGIAAALRSGNHDQLHRAVEHSKAASTRVAVVRADLSTRATEMLGQLRRATMAVDRIDPERNSALHARHRARASELMTELRELEWERRGGPEPTAIASLAEVASSLDRLGASAVSFFRHDGLLHAVRVHDGTVVETTLASVDEVVSLGARVRSDLQAMMAAGLPPAILEVMQQSLRRGLASLDTLLLEPLGVADRPLVVVPQAGLSVVPWTLVPSRRGLPTTVAPCLTAWMHALDTVGASGEPVALLAGPGLLRAEDEVTTLAHLWSPSRRHTGDEATVAAATAAIARAPLVHVAAHGNHRETSPLFSSLLLDDGPLFAHELGRGSAAEVVVLSACELGAATMRQGDEPLGFTAALLDAGVGTVVAGVTRVRDDVAHDVMAAMHHHMAAGASPADAIGRAVAAAWDAGAVAPFTCVGAGLQPLSFVVGETDAG